MVKWNKREVEAVIEHVEEQKMIADDIHNSDLIPQKDQYTFKVNGTSIIFDFEREIGPVLGDIFHYVDRAGMDTEIRGEDTPNKVRLSVSKKNLRVRELENIVGIIYSTF